jgi:hypothetical protein
MLDPSSVLGYMRLCMGLFVLGLPGTIFFVILRRRHDREYFRLQSLMMSRIWPSVGAVAVGLIGTIVLGLTYLAVR